LLTGIAARGGWLCRWRILNWKVADISVAHAFEEIRMRRRHTTESISRTDFGYRALVTVHAAIVTHLEKERSIAEPVATLDAFGAANAQVLINGVLVIRVFDIGPLDGGCRAETVLSAGA
jgi:hypothetical protein